MGIKEKASKGIRGIKEESKVIKGEKSKDKKYSSSKDFTEEESAKLAFGECKMKLFDVNSWSNSGGIATAAFELYSRDGYSLTRERVEKGDFIKIDLPGPLPFYWVRVIEIADGEDSAQFIVQPSYDPTRREDTTATDHFFQDQARSIFRVERNGQEITAMEIGLNEAINNRDSEAGQKGLINTLVSEGGWAGFQKYQWKSLTDYLVGIR
ncbi:MAG: hypothetical protein WD824_21685 [Cyclobacteriaceae bacterium]